MGKEKTKTSFKNLDWTFLNPTVQLSKGISPLYHFEISQTRRHWNDLPNCFPYI